MSVSLGVQTTRVPRPGIHAVDAASHGQARRIGTFEVRKGPVIEL